MSHVIIDEEKLVPEVGEPAERTFEDSKREAALAATVQMLTMVFAAGWLPGHLFHILADFYPQTPSLTSKLIVMSSNCAASTVSALVIIAMDKAVRRSIKASLFGCDRESDVRCSNQVAIMLKSGLTNRDSESNVSGV